MFGRKQESVAAHEKAKEELLQESVSADPTQNSSVTTDLNLEKVKDISELYKTISVYKDRKTGEIFYHKDESPNSRQEYFTALLSKGILHVSDMIEKDGMLFSREINLDNIKEKSSKEEIEAEFFLLNYLFNDGDHDSRLKHNYQKKNGKFAHFDYGKAFNRTNDQSQLSYQKARNPGKSEIDSEIQASASGSWLNDFKSFFDMENFSGPFRFLDQEKFLQEVLIKTNQYLARLEDYSFFDSVIRKSHMDIFSNDFSFLEKQNPDERKKELQAIMVQRLLSLKEIVTEKLIIYQK